MTTTGQPTTPNGTQALTAGPTTISATLVLPRDRTTGANVDRAITTSTHATMGAYVFRDRRGSNERSTGTKAIVAHVTPFERPFPVDALRGNRSR